MIRLIATDMDGTLLDENSSIPEETFPLIEELKAEGVRFCVSSGRRYDTLISMYGERARHLDFVASNGTQVVADGEVLCDLAFSRSDMVRLKEICDWYECLTPVLFSENHRYTMGAPMPFEAPPGETPEDPNYEQTIDYVPSDEPIFKAVVINRTRQDIPDLVYSLTQELGHALNFLPYNEDCIDVMPKGISKATGLSTLMAHIGVGVHELAAFGDSMNDYEMLRFAGHPFVVENGCYVIRSLAEEIIPPNTEHGVQQKMREILEDIRRKKRA